MTHRLVAFAAALLALLPGAVVVTRGGFGPSLSEYVQDFGNAAVLLATLVIVCLLCYAAFAWLLANAGTERR